jgi:hypothetical protein
VLLDSPDPGPGETDSLPAGSTGLQECERMMLTSGQIDQLLEYTNQIEAAP